MTTDEAIASIRTTMEVVAVDVRKQNAVLLRLCKRVAALEGRRGAVVAVRAEPAAEVPEPPAGHLGEQSPLLGGAAVLGAIGVVADEDGASGMSGMSVTNPLTEARALAAQLAAKGTLGRCYEQALLLALVAVVEEMAREIAELAASGSQGVVLVTPSDRMAHVTTSE